MDYCSVLLLLLCSSIAQSQQFGDENCNDRLSDPTPSCVGSLVSCRDFYSATHYPNNITVDEAQAVNGYQLYKILWERFQCSPYSQLFVCLAVSPMCEGGMEHRPCASLCERVSAACNSDIQQSGLTSIGCLLECTRYPTTDCIGPEHPLAAALVVPMTTGPSPDTTIEPTTISTTVEANTSGECQMEPYFTDSAKSFSLGWLAFWSLICFLSTTLTIATFLLDPSRFPYPWRPVIYLALSFNLHSLTHFFAMALGRSLVTCPGNQFVQTSIDWTWGHTPCILVFGLLYFTMLAAFLWWLMLSFSWFLASVFSWSSEAVAHLALFYHLVAWVLPLILTIILVAVRVVSADELTGVCFIVREATNTSFLALLLGVIIPLIACLVTGVILLTIGFVSILRVRAVMRNSGKARESTILEKLMIRIGVFVVVFIIPACVVIGCFVYEFVSRPNWTPLSKSCDQCERANPAVFMVRLFMFLLTGILTGVWIWSRKTLNSWRNFPARVTACCQPPPESVPNPMNAYAAEENIYSVSNNAEVDGMDTDPSDKL